jgi:uncharacterized protein YxeA
MKKTILIIVITAIIVAGILYMIGQRQVIKAQQSFIQQEGENFLNSSL